MKVVIRADSSLKIGTGHIMRCLTLADALKQKGVEIQFICRELPGNIIHIIKSKGYHVSSLSYFEDEKDKLVSQSSWLGTSWQQDAKQTQQIISQQKKPDWLVVDHYALDVDWENQQKDIVGKVLVIDDLADRKHNCDMLLDQNFYVNREVRYAGLVPVMCQQLLGPEYALLRKEFVEARQQLKSFKNSLKKIFVFFGGVDLTNMTAKVIQAFIEMDLDNNIKVDVVIGGSNPHREKIELLIDSLENVTLHVQVENMAQMMAQADLCVGSGGTVTWERCCLALPTIAWSVADNQKELLTDCSEVGLVYAPDGDQPTINDIAIHLQAMLQNSSLRKLMARKGSETVDGKGAARVAKKMLQKNINLRHAVLNDKEKIFIWRNAESVRKYSTNSGEISFENHSKWFDKVLLNDNQVVLIGCFNKEDVGVLRFDLCTDQAEISIYLAPENQGKGLGSALVVSGENWLIQNKPYIKKVIADVLLENKASVKLFECSGYKVNKFQYQKSIA